MKNIKILTLLSSIWLAGGAGAAAQPAGTGKCTDISLVFSLSFTYVDGTTPAALYSDGTGGSNPSYVDGVDGVTAVLHVCGTNPSHDATLLLANSKRTVGIDLTRLVHANSLTPSWTGTPFYNPAFLNVRNILFNYDPNASYSFTTRFGSGFAMPAGPGKSTSYHVRMQNPADQAVPPQPNDSIANTPLNTSLVVLQHTPATATTPETWTAYPDATVMGLTDSGANATQVGALLQDQNNGGPLNAGQFAVPFAITITRK